MPSILHERRGTPRPLPPNLHPVPRETAREDQLLISVIGASGLSANPTLAGPIPRMPRIDPLTPTRLEDVLRYPQPRLLAPMDSVIAVRPFYARTNYTFTAPVLAPLAASLVLQPFNLGGALGGADNSIFGPFSLSAYGNPALGTLLFTHLQNAGWGQLVNISFSDGYASMQAGAFIATGSGYAIPTLQIVGWDDSLGLYLNAGYVNPVTSVVAFGGINAAKAAKRRITNMGPFESPQSARLAVARHLPAHTPLHRVQIRRQQGWAAAIRAGGGLIWISAQIRVGEAHTHDTVYRTYLDGKKAREMINSDHGFWGHARNMATALNWRREPIKIPDLKKPLEMFVGDQFTRVHSASTIISGMVGNLAGWAGAQIFLKGDIQYTARRLDDHIVELTITPLSVHSFGLFGVTTLGLEGTWERGKAKSWRQTFLFDMRKASARVAYDNAVRGRLPGHLRVAHASKNALFHTGDPKWLTELPDGVYVSYLQLMQARQIRYGGGFNAYIIPRGWLPKGWEPSFLAHRVHCHEEQEARSHASHITQDTRSGERRTAAGWKGLASHRLISTSHFTVDDAGNRTFQRLSIGASWIETHASSHELTRRVCRKLQDLFAMQVRDLPEIKPRQDRQITVMRDLDAVELLRLACAARRQRLDLDLIAERYKLGRKNFRKFLAAVYWAPTIEARARVTQKYLQHHGIRAFAAIGTLSPEHTQGYLLQSITHAYDDAISQGDTLLLRFPPWLPKISKREMGKLKKGVGKIDDAKEILRADVFYPPGEIEAVSGKLTQMRDQLNARMAYFARAH